MHKIVIVLIKFLVIAVIYIAAYFVALAIDLAIREYRFRKMHKDFSSKLFNSQETRAREAWAVFGLPKNSSREDLHTAYVKMAWRYHPDRGGDSRKMQEINDAYAFLMNLYFA